MSVYGLKHATPKMKYQHMNYVLNWRADLQEKQAAPPDRHTAIEQIKVVLGSEAFETWYDQVYKLRNTGRNQEYEQAIFAKLAELNQPQPPVSETADLARRSLALIACGKSTHETFRGLEMKEIARLVKKLESQHYWLGKCADGSFIRYLSTQPMEAKGGRAFVGAVGPFLSRLGAAYYARRDAANPKILSPEEAERLAHEDNEGAWPTIRELIEAEMLMTGQEIDDFSCDLAAEYEAS